MGSFLPSAAAEEKEPAVLFLEGLSTGATGASDSRLGDSAAGLALAVMF